MKEKVFTNCFLVKRDSSGKISDICLAMKKRGWGAGWWNGSGGKPNEGEELEKAAAREVKEELNVKVADLNLRAVIDWYLREEDKLVKCYVYFGEKWEGEPTESEEMNPRWYKVKDIPYHQMWESDREWLPIIFEGEMIKAKFTYQKEGGVVEKREIIRVDQL